MPNAVGTLSVKNLASSLEVMEFEHERQLLKCDMARHCDVLHQVPSAVTLVVFLGHNFFGVCVCDTLAGYEIP